MSNAEMRYPIPVMDATNAWKGFDDAAERTKKARARVLEQLVEYGDQAAKQGISYSPIEWKKFANDLAGGFLSNDSPSDEVLRMTLTVQNAKARNWENKTKINQISNPKITEWKKIFSGVGFKNTKMELYVDPESRKKVDAIGSIVAVDDYPNSIENQGKVFQSIIRFVEADCNSKKIRVLQFAAFAGSRGTGQLVHRDEKPNPWMVTVVNDGSQNSVLLTEVCWPQF